MDAIPQAANAAVLTIFRFLPVNIVLPAETWKIKQQLNV
jgi:hypothetical protein